MSGNPTPPRIFRRATSHPGAESGQLLLAEGDRLVDLSAYLSRRGQPDDLVELGQSGWFDGEHLATRLPSAAPDDWQDIEEDWDGNAPADVATPIAPRAVGKILALGKNFRAHAEEFGEEVPGEPLFFNKLPETLQAHRSDVTVPSWYRARVDHEAELALIIGLGGRDLEPEDALEHIAGYTIANDLTLRSLQGDDREQGHPWFRAKNADGFCPLGPAFVARDALDPGNLAISARVFGPGRPEAGELRQDSNTSLLVVDIPSAIAALSRHMSLHPGDLILMGTPEGVGPLEDGDTVICSVAGIGDLSTTIRRS